MSTRHTRPRCLRIRQSSGKSLPIEVDHHPTSRSDGRRRLTLIGPAVRDLDRDYLPCSETRRPHLRKFASTNGLRAGSCYAVLAHIMGEEQRVARKLAITKRLERFRGDMPDADFTRLVNHAAYVDEKSTRPPSMPEVIQSTTPLRPITRRA